MTMIEFSKMHGAGNDFVIINNLDENLQIDEKLARFFCDRNFGIGCDQLLVVAPSKTADFKMEIYNADGSFVEMCGNGIRCFAKYLLDKKLTTKTKLDIETLAGIIKPEIISSHSQNDEVTTWVKVNMGEPILEGKKIPTTKEGEIKNHPIELKSIQDKKIFQITAVSMGNPHAISFVDKVDEFPLRTWGPLMENNEFFPSRVNAEFIEVVNRKEIKMRVWERGSGETLACGTGACASVVASILHEKTDRKVTVHLKGGDLEIEWDKESNHVFMTGPATYVFDGEVKFSAKLSEKRIA
jgi:diaminopimelate epimerase